jgi:NADH:ubiquinone oxidoreductase subunit C
VSSSLSMESVYFQERESYDMFGIFGDKYLHLKIS